MKSNKKLLLLFYFITFTLFTIHFLVNTTACEAYFMHDASIRIFPLKLVIHSFILFIVPALILLFTDVSKLKDSLKLFTVHYLIAFLSVGLFAIAINKPCDSINGGHYMFIDFGLTALSYLLKLLCYVTLGLLSFRVIINKYY